MKTSKSTTFTFLPLFCLLAGLLFWIGATFYNDDLQSVDDLDVRLERLKFEFIPRCKQWGI